MIEHWVQAQATLEKATQTRPMPLYQVGDQVWLEAKNLALPYATRKLAPKCHGPFQVVQQVSPVAYRLRLPLAWTIHDVFHVSLLHLYCETQEHGANYTRPPPDLIEGEQEYEVEAVQAHRYFGRR